MPKQDSAVLGGQRVSIGYTDRPASGWGGLVVFTSYLERIGVRDLLVRALPDGRTSPNQIGVVDMVLWLFATVLTGGRRFAHAERLRADEVMQAILSMRRVPSAMTLTRYFGGFVRSQVEHLSEVLGQYLASRLKSSSLGSVLDLDSTVFERYGHQEGSLKGHNPRKHGRPSHHPILAMLAESKMILHAWLRSGNTGTSRGVSAFLAETLAKLPEGYRLYALRADSGFFVTEFLEDLEARQLPYAIVARMTRPLQHAIYAVQHWAPFGPGLCAAEVRYQAHGWKQPRRIVVIREEERERPQARGRKLFDAPGYTFHAIVTTLTLPPAETWRFYNHRADCENRLKELKDDFGADGFCLDSFDGTEAVFRLLCFLFNLVAEFKREVTANPAPRLSTLRSQVFVAGALLEPARPGPRLRLALRGTWRLRFSGLLARVNSEITSTVSQLHNQPDSINFPTPRPWKTRRSRCQKTQFAAAN